MYYGLNLLRGIAAFGIVGCHLSLSPRTIGGEWVTTLCDFNVGLFAAISGLLMPQAKKGIDYISKRATRLLPTYFAWSAIYVVATAVFDLILDGGALDPRYYSLSNWLDVLFLGSAASHLWFLISLFYGQVLLYLLNGALYKIGDDAKCAILGVVSILLLIASVNGHNWWCYYPIRLMAFLVLGFALKSIKKDVFWGALVFAVILLAVHIGAYGNMPAFVRDYLLVVPTLLLFVSCRFSDNRVASLLAATSMGVYLIHPLFARGVSFVFIRLFPAPYNAFIVAGEWLIVWLLSLLAAILLLRLPLTSRFVR